MTVYGGPEIVTSGLVLLLDAGNTKSYPGTGTRWYDLSGNNAHADAVNSPTFVNNSSRSYWLFDGTDDTFYGVDISQEYRDLFIIQDLSSTTTNALGGSMVFGKYLNQDKSLRFWNGLLGNTGFDNNDWQYNQTEDIFINGVFANANNVNLYDRWTAVRVYRSNDTFSASFRYQLSINFSSRRFKGKIAYICCYNRKLSQSEVLQNYNALKGRFSL